MPRTFIAVQLPKSLRTALGGLSADLARQWPAGAVRWVPAGNIHLTLRFLGDTDEAAVMPIGAALDQLTANQKRFELRLSKVGAFPDVRRPRIIWVGLADPAGELRPLQSALEQLVRLLGWEPEEQRFKPHLTLGRVKRGSRPRDGWPGQEKPHQVEGLCFEVSELELIESRLSSTGAAYSCLHRASFGG